MSCISLKGRKVRPEEMTGTKWEGQGLETLRLLVDDWPINNAVSFPIHWGVQSPDIARLRFEIPEGDIYLKVGDLNNGYFLAELSEATKPLTCFGFYDAVLGRNHIIEPGTCSQGSSPCGTFFNCWIVDIYNRGADMHWRGW